MKADIERLLKEGWIAQRQPGLALSIKGRELFRQLKITNDQQSLGHATRFPIWYEAYFKTSFSTYSHITAIELMILIIITWSGCSGVHTISLIPSLVWSRTFFTYH